MSAKLQALPLGAPAEPLAALPAEARLRRRALSLGAANGFDYAVQFLLPVVLVRCLDAEAFGQYRLLWLAAGAVMAVATVGLPPTLYYFLPRSTAPTKRLYINQTLIALLVTGLIAGWAVSPWNPWLPEVMRGLMRYGALVPAFIVLWVMASLLDLLPTVEERVSWQAKATMGLAAIRAVALSLAALLTRDLGPVLAVLLAFVAFKVALLLVYVAKHHGLRAPLLRPGAFGDQLRYAAPFGAAHALYCLRTQADQWVVASLFSIEKFAAFSIAAVLGPLVNLFRVSVNYVFLPSMSRLHAAGDIPGMLYLNSRANVMVGSLVYPLLAYVFVFAEDLVTLVYTGTYADAAPVMRVCIVGLAALVVELASVTLLLRQGPFLILVNLVGLGLSAVLAWVLGQRFGLAGAAAASVIAIYLDRIVTLWRIARLTGVRIKRLQDWRTLGLLLLPAMLAAALAWHMVGRYLAQAEQAVRLIAGAGVLTAAYIAIAVWLGCGRNWLESFRDTEQRF